MLREAKKSLLTAVPPTHESVFVEHYDRLHGWAVRFTNRDQDVAEDLLHDTYINFTLTRLDLTNIDNIEAYLYTVMRNLHLSQLRKASRMPMQAMSVVDFDTADMGMWASDPRDRLRLRDELGAVCQFACIRKETSKAGSVLILRFFHGYYPEEIAKVLRTTRAVIHERIRRTRAEVRAFLEDPQKVTFLGENPPKPVPSKLNDLGVDLMPELRRVIFESCQGEHANKELLNKSYATEKGEAPDRQVLAHIVSCPKCVDQVNAMLDFPPLESRYLTDTLGNDPGPDDRFGGGSGGGTGGGSNVLDTFKFHRDAHYHHEPEELRIAVNGQLQGFQKVVAGKGELTLMLDTGETLGFIEVFSEMGLRLLMLNVDPPPVGDGTQSLRVNLSSGRTLDADLNFGGTVPALQVRYSDPELMELAAVELSSAPNADVLSVPPAIASDFTQPIDPKTSLFDLFKSFLQPVRLTAVFAGLLIAALLFYKLAPTTVSAAELLNKSAEQEIAQLANKERVLHRTFDLEEHRHGQLTSRKKIDVWQSAEKGITARRLYDEQGQLTMGDWRSANGIQTIYQRGQAAKLQPLPENRTASITFDNAWQLSVSAKEFMHLLAEQNATLEERTNDYLISYSRPGQPSIQKAAIVLSKDDLHAIEQTFTLRDGDETRDYRFVETSYEWKPVSSVAPAVFEPNVELTGRQAETRPLGSVSNADPEATGSDTNTNTEISAPSATLATAALEVEIVEALNNAGAFMGEQINVSRTPDGKVSVAALVETDQRKNALLAALAPHRSNPAVRIKIETVAEAEVAARKQKTKGGQTGTPGSVQQVEVTDNVSPVQAELSKRFTESESKAYANRALGRMRQAWLHSVAMKQISQRFSAADLQSLTPAERSRWISPIRGHADKFLSEAESLRGQLAQVFPEAAAGASGGGAIMSDTELQARVRDLYEASVQLDRGMDRSFSLGSGSAPIKTAAFWRTFSQALGLARSISAVR